MSIEACPAERTKRSRFGQSGPAGSYLRKSCQSLYATGASPIGAPGWPEFAFWTASIARVRIVLMESKSRFCWLTSSPAAGGGHPRLRFNSLMHHTTERPNDFTPKWGGPLAPAFHHGFQ